MVAMAPDRGPLKRPASRDPETVLEFLDVGAQGVMIPMVVYNLWGVVEILLIPVSK